MITQYFLGVYKLPNGFEAIIEKHYSVFDAIDFVKSNKKIKGCSLGFNILKKNKFLNY